MNHLPADRDAEAQHRQRDIAAPLVAIVVLIVSPLLPSSLGAQDTAVAVRPPRIGGLPIVGYFERTGVQYGATLFRFFHVGGSPGTRASSDVIYYAHTAKGHSRAFAQVERWSAGNVGRLRLRAEYLSYPLPFFGIGVTAPRSAEEWYSSGVTTLHVFDQRQIWRAGYVLAGVRYTRSRMREVEPDGVLDSNLVAGSNGGTVSQIQVGVVQDSRDNVSAPRVGTYARLISSLPASDRAESRWSRLTLDARHYSKLRGAQVLAAQLQFDAVTGTVPFDQLPMIGADTAMRGYARGRFRDKNAFATQLEYRSDYWRRLAGVLFAGAGTVADRVGAIPSNRWYPSAGFGARVLFGPRERTIGRFDVGFGRGSVAASIGLGEAF